MSADIPVKLEDIAIGTPVRYHAKGGSIGRLTHRRDDGRITVEWIYGLDVKGDKMTGRSYFGGVNRPFDVFELVPITEAEYDAVATQKGWART